MTIEKAKNLLYNGLMFLENLQGDGGNVEITCYSTWFRICAVMDDAEWNEWTFSADTREKGAD